MNIGKHKKINNSEYRNRILKRSIILLVILIILLSILVSKYLGRDYEYIDNYYKIEPPIQVDIDEKTTIKIGNKELNVQQVAEYELKGYVTATFTYLPYNLGNKLSPKDVTVVWGDLADPDNLKHIKWRESGMRFVLSYTNDTEWLNNYGEYGDKFSNNHLIPSDKRIKRLISKIRKGDFVKIEGYLVNVYYNDVDSEFIWETSTSRYDSGDGSCEIIYVTNVIWLKEEN